MEKSINCTEIAQNLCNLFGVSPENVSVKCYTPSDNVQCIDCSVNCSRPVESVKVKTNFVARNEPERVVETKEVDDTAPLSSDLFKHLLREFGLGRIEYNDNMKESVQNTIKNLAAEIKEKTGNLDSPLGSVVDFLNNVKNRLLEELDVETEDCETEDACECDGHCDKCKCGCQCDAEDCEPEKVEVEIEDPDDNRGITAKTIKENLRKKFNDAIAQRKEEDFEHFRDTFHQQLYSYFRSKILDEKYCSLTTDLDRDDAGIGMEMPANEFRMRYKFALKKSGYDKYLNSEETNVVLDGSNAKIIFDSVADELAEDFEFKDFGAEPTETGGLVIKLWF